MVYRYPSGLVALDVTAIYPPAGGPTTPPAPSIPFNPITTEISLFLNGPTPGQMASSAQLLTDQGVPILCLRASNAYCTNQNGVLVLLNPNTARVEPLGLLVEQASTNLALYNRDFTQAVWTKTNLTATLSEVGMDGAVNSASLLTATGSSASVTQAITLVSKPLGTTFSLYIKRNTGTGTVKIALDGGTTLVDVTSQLVRGRYIRVQAVQILANPIVWLQLGTSGDQITVDLAQLEGIPWSTSPILTTTASAARAADQYTVPAPGIFLTAPATPFSFGVSVQAYPNALPYVQGAYAGVISGVADMSIWDWQSFPASSGNPGFPNFMSCDFHYVGTPGTFNKYRAQGLADSFTTYTTGDQVQTFSDTLAHQVQVVYRGTGHLFSQYIDGVVQTHAQPIFAGTKSHTYSSITLGGNYFIPTENFSGWLTNISLTTP